MPTFTTRLPALLRGFALASGLAALAGVAGAWWWWGVGFDEAESQGVASPSTDAAMVTSFWVAVSGLAGLALVAVVAVLRRRQKARP